MAKFYSETLTSEQMDNVLQKLPVANGKDIVHKVIIFVPQAAVNRHVLRTAWKTSKNLRHATKLHD